MHTLYKIACATTLLAALPLQAAPILDQNQDVIYTIMASFHHATLAQSFRQTNTNISGAGLYLTPFDGNTTADVTMSLWTALPNQVGATMLASGNATANGDGWVDMFWSPVNILANTSYYLVFSGTRIPDTTGMGIMGSIGNQYTNGGVFAGNGFTNFTSFGYDYTFRTWADDGLTEEEPPVTSIPEPASLALLSLGLFGIYTRRWTAEKL